MKSGIYIITNLVNNNCYIGKTNNFKRRFIEHKNINHESNPSLKLAYKKYGLENFKFDILEECHIEKLNEREIFWISKLKPKYNRTAGGDGISGCSRSDETKNILRIRGKSFWETLSEEQKNKIITQNLTGPRKGHKLLEKTKEKLRVANLGKKQSKETIEKRKQTMYNKKKNGYTQTNAGHKKPIYCEETREKFNSVNEAAQKYNLTTLSGHLKGRYKTCKRLHYKYCSVETNCDECSSVS